VGVEPVEKLPIPDWKARNQLILLNAKKRYQTILDFFDRHLGCFHIVVYELDVGCHGSSSRRISIVSVIIMCPHDYLEAGLVLQGLGYVLGAAIGASRSGIDETGAQVNYI
jgi:hypothetical protein